MFGTEQGCDWKSNDEIVVGPKFWQGVTTDTTLWDSLVDVVVNELTSRSKFESEISSNSIPAGMQLLLGTFSKVGSGNRSRSRSMGRRAENSFWSSRCED